MNNYFKFGGLKYYSYICLTHCIRCVLMHFIRCCVSVKNKKKRGQKNFINERILKYYKRM